MDYVIANPSKKVFIRLGKGGAFETCTKSMATYFEKEKAKNVLKNLPKTLRKFNFSIFGNYNAPDLGSAESNVDEDNVIFNAAYRKSDSVDFWINKMKEFQEFSGKALKRKSQLVQDLSNVDKEVSNCIHKIELTNWKNGCDGYKEYRTLKMVLEKRRKIKDELIVVSSILNSHLNEIEIEEFEKTVNWLNNRVFKIRETNKRCELELFSNSLDVKG